MDWDTTWRVAQRHVLPQPARFLPEALEQWPRSLFGGLLPRHLEIVDEINYGTTLRRLARSFQTMKIASGGFLWSVKEHDGFVRHGLSGSPRRPRDQ